MMIDKATTIFTAIIFGGVAIRIATNKNSAGTIGAFFHGIAADISASFG
jgi:hypothetical protein